jgi:dipeptidyl aminopeptidase/acylaminoacyl peptidase
MLHAWKRLPALALLLASIALAEAPPLIPRQVLFGSAEREQPRLSPDGQQLAWLQPDQGVVQIWVQTVGASDAVPVTAERQRRPISSFDWAQDGRSILYAQGTEGDENSHLFQVELATRAVRDLTPFPDVRAELLRTSSRLPTQILATLNRTDPGRVDVYRIDLGSGAATLDTPNPGDVVSWAATDDLVVKAVEAQRSDGGSEIRVRDGTGAPWRVLTRVGADDTLELHDLTADGASVIYTTSAGGKTGRVVERALSGGKEKLLASHPQVDPGRVWIHPARHVVQGVVFEPALPAWTLLDPTVKKDFDIFPHLARGFPEVVSRDGADRTWVVAIHDPRGPTRYFRFDRESLKGTFLFSDRPALEAAPLVEATPVAFAARDGLPLHGYLTRAAGVKGRAPMVLGVHGGPWLRVGGELDPEAQWLANRGYSVLKINYRGSAGYGRVFLNAGNKQWGKAMQRDLLDAVDFAVRQGVADRSQVAIHGRSHGGYAALAAAAFTPEVFRCAVDLAGVSNLLALIHGIPPDWKSERALFDRRVGNVELPADKAMLEAASPVFSAERIRIPLLIGQGGKDRRVTPAGTEQLVAALEKRGRGVTYVLYPDEGHLFRRPENAMDFRARTEAFLAACLGGRAEPLEGERVAGSTAVVKVVEPRPPAQ